MEKKLTQGTIVIRKVRSDTKLHIHISNTDFNIVGYEKVCAVLP